MLKTSLVDGAGTSNEAFIGNNNQLYVSQIPTDLPPIGTNNRMRFLSQYVSSVGDGTGTTNMKVDGSATNQYFYIKASNDYDLHIMRLLFYVQDGSVSHSTFGALAALTNGVNCYIEEGESTSYLLQNVKAFSDFIEQTGMEKPFGTGTASFELGAVSGAEDGWLLPFNVAEFLPACCNGIRLGRGTQDKLVIQIRDNLSALTIFTCRMLGFKHYERTK